MPVMKAAVVVILAVIALGSLSSTSCFVDRLSDRYTCTSDAQCMDGRTCNNGYCVQSPCPTACSSCDVAAKICNINCTQNRPCGDVQCPDGYDCRIDCSRAGSCGRITCGPGPCDISCTGAGACPSIDCTSSCACDVRCNNAVGVCPDVSCPMVLGTACTDSGMAGAPCDSSGVCDTCP
jgi:hypothetical protein